MRILLAGDIHGDARHLEYLFRVAGNTRCDRIVALGDFGFWPASESEFLEKAHELTTQPDAPTLYWLDGNHEDHTALRILQEEAFYDVEGFMAMDRISSKFLYIPRSLAWVWDDVKFVAIGGAFSVDRAARTLNESWFPEEIITPRDLSRAVVNAAFLQPEADEVSIDVVLSHDAPESADLPAHMLTRQNRQLIPIEESARQRRLLETFRKIVQPRYWFHGHYHLNYRYRIETPDAPPTLIEGLDRNRTTGFSWTVLDTQDLHSS